MAVHKPGSTWSLRDPGYGSLVRTLNEQSLEVLIVEPGMILPLSFHISRADARLLAKRINACLDATTVKGA